MDQATHNKIASFVSGIADIVAIENEVRGLLDGLLRVEATA